MGDQQGACMSRGSRVGRLACSYALTLPMYASFSVRGKATKVLHVCFMFSILGTS